jgi:hypothetical protein
MKTRNAQADAPAGALRPASGRRLFPPRPLRLLGDAVLVALLAWLTVQFLSHNGFIGNGEIQAYPY